MHIQNSNKLCQYRYLVNYKKRICHITPNCLEPGRSKAMNLYQKTTKVSPCYWLNVLNQNPNNPKDISLQFYQVDKGNMFQVSLTIIQSTTRESISVSKCTKQMSSPSFETLSVNSKRQSTPKSVYHTFNNPPRTNENINRQSKGFHSPF